MWDPLERRAQRTGVQRSPTTRREPASRHPASSRCACPAWLARPPTCSTRSAIPQVDVLGVSFGGAWRSSSRSTHRTASGASCSPPRSCGLAPSPATRRPRPPRHAAALLLARLLPPDRARPVRPARATATTDRSAPVDARRAGRRPVGLRRANPAASGGRASRGSTASARPRWCSPATPTPSSRRSTPASSPAAHRRRARDRAAVPATSCSWSGRRRSRQRSPPSLLPIRSVSRRMGTRFSAGLDCRPRHVARGAHPSAAVSGLNA